MRTVIKALGVLVGTAACVSLMSCGGGSLASSPSTTSPPTTTPPVTTTNTNVATVTVDQGPSGNSVNTLFTTVTVCVPNSTTNCQTIDHIQVDTGSYGLRLLASALTLTLPVQAAASGGTLVECTQFADGYSWGPVALADMTIAGETAESLPIQVIGDSRFPTVPADCSSVGGSSSTAENTVTAFGANGLLGIGVFAQDCGAGCAAQVIPATYYACSSATCQGTAAATNLQVTNPISKFTVDNNGSIISLPAVAAAGAATLTGSLIFGVDTQSNNESGTETVLTLDNTGEFTTVFSGNSLTHSFIDSGSNGTFFTATSLPVCTSTNFKDFYCPAADQTFTATLMGNNSVTYSNTFVVANAQTMVTANSSFNVFPELAGTFPSDTDAFDWGLPFFYGRRVANVIETHSTSVGTGPYVAF